MTKLTALQDAVALIPDGAVLMIGGFMGVGSPHRLIDELVRQGKKDLTIIANDTARKGVDIGKLIGVRTVKATVSKSAQGLVVPLSAIEIVNGVPGINLSYGDSALRVEVDILAKDDRKAVIRAKNASDNLTAGMKYLKP